MNLFALIILIISSSLLLLSSLAFLKSRDVFSMTHVTMIINCYVMPMILIGVEIDRFSIVSFSKILCLILLNIIAANLLCHAILRRAVINRIKPVTEKSDDL